MTSYSWRKRSGGLREAFLRQEDTGSVFPTELEIPVLGNLLGQGETLLLGGGTALFAANRGRTLPGPTLAPLIELNLTAEDS